MKKGIINTMVEEDSRSDILHLIEAWVKLIVKETLRQEAEATKNETDNTSTAFPRSATKGDLPPTLDVVDVAAYLMISKYTVINRIKQGQLRAYKQGKRWKIKREWPLEHEAELISRKGVK